MTTSLFITLTDTINGQAGVYDLLRDGLQHTPGITGLVILSNDGIAQAAYGLDTENALRIGAACASMASLSGRIATDVDGDQVLHTAITMNERNVLITGCGPDSTVLVVVEATAPVGLALSEVVRRARAFATQVGTTPRFHQTAGR